MREILKLGLAGAQLAGRSTGRSAGARAAGGIAGALMLGEAAWSLYTDNDSTLGKLIHIGSGAFGAVMLVHAIMGRTAEPACRR